MNDARESEANRRLQTLMKERPAQLARRVESSVRPFAVSDANGDADVIGSCVLLRAQNRIFAISAKHVFQDGMGARMYVGIQPGFVEIESEILIKSSKKGFKVYSVPIKTIYRDEVSQIHPLKDTLRFIRYFVKEIFNVERTKPK